MKDNSSNERASDSERDSLDRDFLKGQNASDARFSKGESSTHEPEQTPSIQKGAFPTTHWTAVVEAGQQHSPRAEAALTRLYSAYWYPLYSFVRGRGYAVHDAQDLTQDFFAALLKKNHLDRVDREKGRFRSYLLGALKHFLANEWHKSQRQKRGGNKILVPLDELLAEERFAQEPGHDATPEKIFDRNWAEVLLERIMVQLRSEQAEAGKTKQFDELKVFLSGEKSAETYSEIAVRLETSEASIKVGVHRLRQRYRELLRSEIANTVANPGEIEDELRHLISVLRN